MYDLDPDEELTQSNWWRAAECSEYVEFNPDMVNAWTPGDVYLEQQDAYIPADNFYTEKAKRICADCPVRKFCLVEASEDELAEGIRGGYTFAEGALVKEEALALEAEFGLVVPIRRKWRARIDDSVWDAKVDEGGE